MFRRICGISLLFLLVVPVLAHDLYIMPKNFMVQPGQTIVVAIHGGDDFPIGETVMTPDRVTDSKLVGSGGSWNVQNIHAEKGQHPLFGEVTVPSAGTFVLTTTSTPRVNSMDAKKFEEDVLSDGLDHVVKYRAEHGETDKPAREQTHKFTKALLVSGQPSDFGMKPLGLTMEILLEKNPTSLKAGESLPIQVVYLGKPAGGLQVEAAWVDNGPAKVTKLGRTGANGRFSIPLQKGKCRLSIKRMERAKDQSVADWDSYLATLTFEQR